MFLSSKQRKSVFGGLPEWYFEEMATSPHALFVFDGDGEGGGGAPDDEEEDDYPNYEADDEDGDGGDGDDDEEEEEEADDEEEGDDDDPADTYTARLAEERRLEADKLRQERDEALRQNRETNLKTLQYIRGNRQDRVVELKAKEAAAEAGNGDPLTKDEIRDMVDAENELKEIDAAIDRVNKGGEEDKSGDSDDKRGATDPQVEALAQQWINQNRSWYKDGDANQIMAAKILEGFFASGMDARDPKTFDELSRAMKRHNPDLQVKTLNGRGIGKKRKPRPNAGSTGLKGKGRTMKGNSQTEEKSRVREWVNHMRVSYPNSGVIQYKEDGDVDWAAMTRIYRALPHTEKGVTKETVRDFLKGTRQ